MKTSSAHVLAVEPDADIAFDLRQLLRNLGAETTIASSGDHALKLVWQRRFDLVIVNPRLPGINGLDVFRCLKQDPDLEAVPVIFAADEASQYVVNEAFRLGAVDFLTRPYGMKDFLKRVSAHLAKPLTLDETANRPGATLQLV